MTSIFSSSFPPLITGRYYENHYRLQKYGRDASIEWIDIDQNNADVYNAGIHVYDNDTRWWDVNGTGKTVMNFPIGLAYCVNVDLIVWTRKNAHPRVSVRINRIPMQQMINGPVDWKFEENIYRFTAGGFGKL